MMYEYPENVENGRDILKWFAWYYEEKTGTQIPNSFWSKGAGFINRHIDDYSLDEIACVVWGVCNIKPQTRSMWSLLWTVQIIHKRDLRNS